MKTRSPHRSRLRSLPVSEPASPPVNSPSEVSSAIKQDARRRLKIGAPGLKDLKFQVFLTCCFRTDCPRHAPSVREAIAEFDGEFYERLCESGVRPHDSRRQAIREIEADRRAASEPVAQKHAPPACPRLPTKRIPAAARIPHL